MTASAALAAVIGLAGCGGLERIDRRVGALLAETSAGLGADVLPRMPDYFDEPARLSAHADPYDKHVPTVNPPAPAIQYDTLAEADDVVDRLERYNEVPDDAIPLDLEGALAHAIRSSREYRFAEEEYVLLGLRLLVERHQWGPRFFNDLSVDVATDGDDGLFDSSVSVVNELRVTQRLPYGGTVAARALARATEDLHRRVAGEKTQSAELLLTADVPLLRGAGLVAQESLIQAERNMIYAAREFERFRREYLFDISQDFLSLVVQRQRIENSVRQLQLLEQLEARTSALVRAGREPPFEAALAAQDTLFARDRLNSQRESYRLAVDRFKVRLGMDPEIAVIIEPSTLDLPLPSIRMEEAVRAGLTYRLDLQTARDRLADARRRLENAVDELQPDLDLRAEARLPTDPDRGRAGLDFEPDEISGLAGITLGLPLDREIERIGVRQSQIDLERERRSYEEFRDRVSVDVRGSIRDIDRARFTLQLQEENIRIAELRQASIDAAPDRADARERSEAAQRYLEALDARDDAARDLQVAILQYLLDTGQLRVRADGSIQPLAGMPPRPIG